MKFKEFMGKIGMIKESPDQWYRAEGAMDDEPTPTPEEVTPPTVEPEVKPVESPFKEGDILILADNKRSSKIPEDAWDFLMTFKEFKVERVSDTGKLDLGCHISKNTPEGGVEKIYMFSPKRFALKNSSDKPTDIKDEEFLPL